MNEMKKYEVTLEGKNFLLKGDDEQKRLGLCTTRWVEASTPEEAELSAVNLIKNDSKLKNSVLNEKDDPPMIYLEEIAELENFDGVNPPGEGYCFFPYEEEN